MCQCSWASPSVFASRYYLPLTLFPSPPCLLRSLSVPFLPSFLFCSTVHRASTVPNRSSPVIMSRLYPYLMLTILYRPCVLRRHLLRVPVVDVHPPVAVPLHHDGHFTNDFLVSLSCSPNLQLNMRLVGANFAPRSNVIVVPAYHPRILVLRTSQLASPYP